MIYMIHYNPYLLQSGPLCSSQVHPLSERCHFNSSPPCKPFDSLPLKKAGGWSITQKQTIWTLSFLKPLFEATLQSKHPHCNSSTCPVCPSVSPQHIYSAAFPLSFAKTSVVLPCLLLCFPRMALCSPCVFWISAFVPFFICYLDFVHLDFMYQPN